ncbi:serine/threonine protein phosphatase [Novosphingobium sp. PC22D]|nr:serine/threonine protein phosphatase [Novosphingobium sp. PC22D]
MFRKSRPSSDVCSSPTRPGSIPTGERVYAIGDVHGRLDLLLELSKAIQDDDSARGPAATTVIFLGDLIDRGPHSAHVIEFVREWSKMRAVRTLMGNHEDMLLASFDNLEVFANFLRYGGRETILSYPIDAEAFAAADLIEAQAMMDAAIPQADRDFIAGFESRIVVGDYAFVHAGVRPDCPLPMQLSQDLRWIREPFLSYSGTFDYIVVHGHTITKQPDHRLSRIGIDTGAFATGRLTALGLEGTDRWIIQANVDEDDTISVSQRAA